MRARGTDPDAVREIRLDGFGLIVAAGLLLMGLAGAFFVGRAYERRVAPPSGPRIAGLPFDDPAAPVVRGETEVGAGDVFDRADDAAALEPERQAAPLPDRDVKARQTRPKAQAAEVVAADGGEFFVQVFAGRDQAAAAGLVRRLEEAGHAVRLLTEREGAGALYKVRVGGFSSRDRAGDAASTLQQQGYSGAWVTRAK